MERYGVALQFRLIKIWKLWKLKKQIEDEKSNTFSASSKNMKFGSYKLQTMVKTFVQKFLEYVEYFFRYNLPSKNGQKHSKHRIVCLKTGQSLVTKFLESWLLFDINSFQSKKLI